MALLNLELLILLLLFFFFTSIFKITTARPPLPSPGDLDAWCQTVPHPGPCRFFMGRYIPNNLQFNHRQESDFQRMAVDAALQRAVEARSGTRRWRMKFNTGEERAAWADCAQLYDSTIMQLNRTLHCLDKDNINIIQSMSCTHLDVRTWLSAALTNLDTCRLSADELNVTTTTTGLVFPHVLFNVSEMISNCLAISSQDEDKQKKTIIMQHKESNINYDENEEEEDDDDDKFPRWMGRVERRLLGSSRWSTLEVAASNANLVVAKDGSGHFRTVQEAIDAAGEGGSDDGRVVVILVKRGVYEENVYVNYLTDGVMLVGEGTGLSIITGHRSAHSGHSTYNSATVGIDGFRFMARGITFENKAGPTSGQAVALRSSSDYSVFYQCAFNGYQDTLYIHSSRQFYRECDISGTIDFIFGNAAVVFQGCNIIARKPAKGHRHIVITAHGRDNPEETTGIVIHNCKIIPSPELLPVFKSYLTYLGRPWRRYARTVVMRSELGSLVHPAGWLEMGHDVSSFNTLYYGEYQNFGPGSSLRRRVRWPGFHAITSEHEASRFTVRSLIGGESWLPSTGVPYTSDL
ncbi:hypothetical protein Dimus_000436 [Dionaea muscipula]